MKKKILDAQLDFIWNWLIFVARSDSYQPWANSQSKFQIPLFLSCKWTHFLDAFCLSISEGLNFFKFLFFFFFNKRCLIFLYSAWQQMEIMIFSLGYDCGMIQYLTKQLFPTMLIFMLFGSSKENYTCLKILSLG